MTKEEWKDSLLEEWEQKNETKSEPYEVYRRAIEFFIPRIESLLAAERTRIAGIIKEIPELNVGDWTVHAVKAIGLERLEKQDAANEGWNNCRKLVIELLQTP